MNRKNFEDAKSRIAELCYTQKEFNGKTLMFDQPFYRQLPDGVSERVANYTNEIFDTEIIKTARDLIAAVDSNNEVTDPLDPLVSCVKDIHFRKDGTVEIKYNDGTIGKVEDVYSVKVVGRKW